MPALYIQTFESILQKYPDEFSAFSHIHDLYQKHPDDLQIKSEFDRLGKPVLDIVQHAQNSLCRKMENSNRGKYSSSLSDKFLALVRQHYPLFDFIGVSIT